MKKKRGKLEEKSSSIDMHKRHILQHQHDVAYFIAT
jgi:hypothetical protein